MKPHLNNVLHIVDTKLMSTFIMRFFLQVQNTLNLVYHKVFTKYWSKIKQNINTEK